MPSPEIDHDGMRRRVDEALEKEMLGQPLTGQERRIVQYVLYSSRAARPVDPEIQVRVNPPEDERDG